jgi:hypothetical protein
MYAITWQTNLISRLGDMDVFILLVSCICHDLDHPGYNNVYQINAKTELALRYVRKKITKPASFLSARSYVLITQHICQQQKILINSLIPKSICMKKYIFLGTMTFHHWRIIIARLPSDYWNIRTVMC